MRNILQGKEIVLGVSGGIAAYKAVELVSMLRKEGASVHVVMTKNATRFVTPLTFEAISGNPVLLNTFDSPMPVPHIELTRRSDLFIVAPATGNLLGKIQSGIADDLLTTCLLAANGPVLLVPSMNTRMWENTIVRQNVLKLKGLGYRVLEPEEGQLVCGEEGKGRLPRLEEIVEMAKDLVTDKDLSEETILVTAGATVEPIDPVRFISNRSSGKMGFAIAKVARRRGADVILIAGRTEIDLPRRDITIVRVETAMDMREAVLQHFSSASIVIKAAAVSDFRCKNVATRKIKKDSTPVLELERNPDILKELGEKKEGRILVGFAAETHEAEQSALIKLREKNLDMIVVNDVSKQGIGFGSDLNEVVIISSDGKKRYIPPSHKEDVAQEILNAVKEVRERSL
jgi:phosphopantothenoylcysteine decarboxylase/phosphopantothenate--cysteine ligase